MMKPSGILPLSRPRRQGSPETEPWHRYVPSLAIARKYTVLQSASRSRACGISAKPPFGGNQPSWRITLAASGMHRFLEQQNIAYLERILATEIISDRSRHLLGEQLLAAQRRLAALMAVNAGLKPKPLRERAFPCVS